MRIGIIADVHCNHEGLRLALEQMDDVDELVCAGDAVYQFRFSNEVVEMLRDRDARYVIGNHEETLLGPWGERARAADWVRQDLMQYASQRPARIDARIDGKQLVVFHGSPSEPRYEYIYPNSASIVKFAEVDADYVIVGHTHYQMARRVGRALVINPGSAGEARDPRNGFRLSCAVLDTASGEVVFHDFADPTRAAVDPAIIPGSSDDSHPSREYQAPNTNFWTPG
jgi:putative phosphoesterase